MRKIPAPVLPACYPDRYSRKMVLRMTDVEEVEEKRVVAEFCHLLEKSKQLFNGLRDLPPYGYKQWQTYFGRAFDVYTKLWKFQQQHRLILDKKYTLKRWQIGEIASKIGQLYYHYYLRTSETNYLHEAFQFYGAIRARGYYSRKEERSELIVKKLRYFARFIVVCLLLKKMKNVRELVQELSQHIDDYTSTYEPEDQLEWSLVLSEIRAFIEADSPVSVVESDGSEVTLNMRITTATIPPLLEKSPQMTLTLQEVLVVGTKSEQVKFSELTMDMFRMLQTLEREPQPTDELMCRGSGNNMACALKRENPRKSLLYKPSLEHLMVYLSSGWKDLEHGGVLLIYISGDVVTGREEAEGKRNHGYQLGGISTLKKEDGVRSSRVPFHHEPQCLYSGDLVPFTRKPLFLIMESENSHVFQELSTPFGTPVAILMSPEDMPTFLHESEIQTSGSLFTLFLHSPLSAFCSVAGITALPISSWDYAQTIVQKFMMEAQHAFMESDRDDCYMDFFGDDFLRLLILRYIFCLTVLKLHRGFQDCPTFLPRSQPYLSCSSPVLARTVLDLCHYLVVTKTFCSSDC